MCGTILRHTWESHGSTSKVARKDTTLPPSPPMCHVRLCRDGGMECHYSSLPLPPLSMHEEEQTHKRDTHKHSHRKREMERERERERERESWKHATQRKEGGKLPRQKPGMRREFPRDLHLCCAEKSKKTGYTVVCIEDGGRKASPCSRKCGRRRFMCPGFFCTKSTVLQ